MTRRAKASLGLVTLSLVLFAGLVAGCGTSKTPQTGATTTDSPRPAPRQTVTGNGAPIMRQAAAAYNAYGRAFYKSSGSRAKYTDTVGTGTAVFWRQAELIEMTEDAYQASHDPALKQQIVALMIGVRYQYSRNWTRRTWNDDIEWMIIAAVRAYQLTGDRAYLTMAKINFDGVYARAWSSDFGGGLWWITGGKGRVQKNVTTNATAAIAAALLGQALHDPSYTAKAEQLYAWLRRNLFDPRTGAVWDNLSRARSRSGTVTNKAGLTYNQGTFVGAAGLLYKATHKKQYYNDALKAITYTKDVMSHGGVLPAEAGGNGNLLGFKGIFVRWALAFLRDNHISTFDAWFRLNAASAWQHRNSQGLIGPDWSKTTQTSGLDSWGASCAVVLLEDLSRP